MERDRFADAIEQVGEALTIARERGDRVWEQRLLGHQLMPLLYVVGRWDEAVQVGVPLLAGEVVPDAVAAAALLISIGSARGDEATVERCVARARREKNSTYVDQRVAATFVLSRIALERGSPEEALSLAKGLLDEHTLSGDTIEEVFALNVEAAIALRDPTTMEQLEAYVAGLPPARATSLLRAGRARLRAELAHRSGDDASALEFEDEAIALLRSVGARSLLAQALSERSRRHGDTEALVEARAIYEELGAARWLERIGEATEVTA
jgi:hypothetical protein